MTIRVQAAPPAHHSWLAERAELTLLPGFMALEAVDEGGRIVGMVGFELGWRATVMLHIAVEHPAALRHLIRSGFGAAFDPPPRGFGRVTAIATVLSTNTRSLKLVRHLGFKHIHTGRDYMGPGVHVEYFEMRREECRWISDDLRRAA